MAINHTSSNLAPESAYNNANNELAAKLERLEDLVSNLRHRLTPVLEPRGDGKAAAECGAQAMRAATAPLVAALEFQAARVANLGDEVNDLLQRLCL